MVSESFFPIRSSKYLKNFSKADLILGFLSAISLIASLILMVNLSVVVITLLHKQSSGISIT